MMYTIIRVNFKNMLRKRSQTQKTIYYLIPLTLDVQKRQIYRDRKQVGGCLWLGVTLDLRGLHGEMECSKAGL